MKEKSAPDLEAAFGLAAVAEGDAEPVAKATVALLPASLLAPFDVCITFIRSGNPHASP
jgi:hypothetical protein